jgi:hypothetical protein
MPFAIVELLLLFAGVVLQVLLLGVLYFVRLHQRT